MRYLPQTEIEIKKICETLAVNSPQDLFETIPQPLKLKHSLLLPAALSEQDLLAHLKNLSRSNETVDHTTSFLGAGAYHHYIPVAVGYLAGRGEFSTSYTPYQAELSQGTLQAIFEFQTMVASLLGLDVANASNYDGATALAEAVLMALRIKKKKQVILAKSIHPDTRNVVKTNLKNLGYLVKEVGWDEKGKLNLQELGTLLSHECSAVCVQSPNFFGGVEDLQKLGEIIHQKEALFVVASGDPVSLGLLASPGSCGADIAVAEGQSFGNFLNFGGPYLGLFATKKEYIRQMPGRLAGETLDADGKRGFILTMNTREQHIRREKATSNICTNQSLCALAAAIHLSLLGPRGLRLLAEINLSKSEYLKKNLLKIPGIKLLFSGPTFNEFALSLPKPAEPILDLLRQQKFFGGLSLQKYYPELENTLLLCVTEMIGKEELDRFVEEMRNLI